MPPVQKRHVLISTGEAPFPYTVLDVVFALGAVARPAFGAYDVTKAFQQATDLLEKEARRIGGNAVFWTQYQGEDLGAVGYQVIATGTAVLLKRTESEPS